MFTHLYSFTQNNILIEPFCRNLKYFLKNFLTQLSKLPKAISLTNIHTWWCFPRSLRSLSVRSILNLKRVVVAAFCVQESDSLWVNFFFEKDTKNAQNMARRRLWWSLAWNLSRFSRVLRLKCLRREREEARYRFSERTNDRWPDVEIAVR